jgi:hypothetical protein
MLHQMQAAIMDTPPPKSVQDEKDQLLQHSTINSNVIFELGKRGLLHDGDQTDFTSHKAPQASSELVGNTQESVSAGQDATSR